MKEASKRSVGQFLRHEASRVEKKGSDRNLIIATKSKALKKKTHKYINPAESHKIPGNPHEL